MFGWFNKNSKTYSVTDGDKEWIEKNLAWFIEIFGLDHLASTPFILPTKENFPYKNTEDEKQFQSLFEQVCGYWSINPNEIIVKLFDDITTKQWSTWKHGEISEGALGLFEHIYTTDEKRFKIEIARSNFSNAELLVNIISHELGHVKLIGKNLVKHNEPDMEPLTDLASIFFGFGIFMANTSITNDGTWINRTGYMRSQMIAYANALLCFITDRDCKEFEPYLNLNTKDFFRNDYGYLKDGNHTFLDKWQVEMLLTLHKNRKIIEDGFEKREFEKVIESARKLVSIKPSSSLYNSLGYALMQLKRYQEAIVEFTNAIDKEPYFAFAYNNRGYCKLQLNDTDNAFADIHSSYEMNPENSFAWRNLGVYYYLLNNFEEALYYLEEAEKMNTKTELINFYLAKVHTKLGNKDKALLYLEKSVASNEYNDSLIE